MKKLDLNYYPGFKRKAISFTIDDGNLRLDKKFIDMVSPAGIKGSFNLISSAISDANRDEYISLYRGYEIANHMKFHPMGFRDGLEAEISDEPFNPETADKAKLYKSAENPRLYHYCHRHSGRWFLAADNETYIRLINEGKRELEAIFGEGSIKDFVWPYGRQSDTLYALATKLGYRSIRGSIYDGFDLPENRNDWGFYADCKNMTERAAEFDSLPDDGKLKAFIFGVHSHDFENAGKWDVLEDFCRKYGNRHNDFFYGSVGEIFDTEDAIKAASITEHSVTNNASVSMYVMLDGEKHIINPGEVLCF